ncbi:hypothetical protein BOTBODRAFT_28107 [Botryobasidium botryosum FD-172 SS1]|uniref:FAD-binding domain-containing protein n=1 Tax=Botryobasidium botryosum (strain FD-172 SS1) TaxID=930990 RepID=A0A067N6X3_BOTB1|nr:hypothetical protein BOTBODRAFT_28107 [Botryobasidium botryosum FD-172 SS1]
MPEALATKPRESQVDVLVVGAGPTGLLLAFALVRAGVSVRVIDIKQKKIVNGHADGIHPRTLEVLQSYGLVDRVLKNSVHIYAFASWNPSPDGGIVRTALTPFIPSPTARYPFSVTFAQSGIEGCFRDGMKEDGVEVEQGVMPIALEISDDKEMLQSPTAYPVKITLQRLQPGEVADRAAAASQVNGDESEIVRAKYVVGADGAHSWVRQALGIEMIGEGTNSVWGVVDSVPETDFPDIRTFSSVNSPNGSFIIVPREGNLVRIYVQLTEVDVDQTGRLDRSKFTAEDIMKVAQKYFYPYKLAIPKVVDWWTVYIVGQRVASSYSVKNRVLIAGDACHTHSPKGGQGMNAGLNDAHNLAWKLVYVLRQWAPISFLDTYDAERRNFAKELIDFDKYCIKMFAAKVKTDGDDTEGVTQGELATAYTTHAGFTSGIGIQYHASTIINVSNPSLAANLVIVQRLPPAMILRMANFCPVELHDLLPSDTRFKVLILPGDISDPKQKAKLDAIAARLDQPQGFLKRFTPPNAPEDAVFDIITISRTEKTVASTQMIPPRLLSHWEKAYIDAESFCGRVGGKLYATYGVANDGAIIISRPDGYVGMVAALDDVDAVGEYFSGFLKAQPDA